MEGGGILLRTTEQFVMIRTQTIHSLVNDSAEEVENPPTEEEEGEAPPLRSSAVFGVGRSEYQRSNNIGYPQPNSKTFSWRGEYPLDHSDICD